MSTEPTCAIKLDCEPLLAPHPSQVPLIDAKELFPSRATNCVSAFLLEGDVEVQRLADAYRIALAQFDATQLALEPNGQGRGWRLTGNSRTAVVVDELAVDPGNRGDLNEGVLRKIEEICRYPFDLEEGPLGLVHIFPLSRDRCVVCETFDHVVADGHSLDLLHLAVSNIYRDGELPSLPETYRSFLEVSARNPSDSTSSQFWRRLFDGFEPRFLPEGIEPVCEASISKALGRELLDEIRNSCSRTRCTLSSFILSAYALAIARHTGECDISIQVVANVRQGRFLNLFGQATSLVPVRTSFKWSDSFETFVSGVSETILNSLDNVSSFSRDLVPNVVFNGAVSAQYSFHRMSKQGLSLGNAVSQELAVPNVLPFGDAHLKVRQMHDGSLELELHSGAGSKLSDRADAILESTLNFLRISAISMALPVGCDDLLPERQLAIIDNLRIPSAAYPFEFVHLRILRSLKGIVSEVVIDETRGYSGPEIRDAVAAKICALRALGVQGGRVVAVEVSSAFERICSFLAILRLGCVYVPILPSTEPELNHQLKSSACVDACISDSGVFPFGATSPDIRFKTSVVTQSQDSPAYIIFTSGSTGRPKGVVVSHAALSNFAIGEKDRFDLNCNSRILLIAPPNVDPWIGHVSGALASGATLVVAAPLSAVSLAKQVLDKRVTHAFLPAALFPYIAELPQPNLRVAATAGDHCRMEDVGLLDAPDCRIFNIYGPTETTITATLAQLGGGETRPSIGVPIKGLGAHVLLDSQTVAPLGVMGELHLSGVGVAIGYTGDETATRAKFTADERTRVFATGDLATLAADGLLYLHGRSDRQIKLRGFRVELDEVERQFRNLGISRGVHALAVPGKETRLAVFLTGCALDEARLEIVRSSVSSNIRPHFLRCLEDLPLTPAGKVDHQQLLQLISVQTRKSNAKKVIRPTSVAARLGVAWENAVGVTPSPRSNFFAEGGDSLTVLRFVRNLRMHGLVVSPSDVFRCPWFDDLAAVAREETSLSREAKAVPRGPLSSSQKWFYSLDLPQPERWVQSIKLWYDQLPGRDLIRNAVERLGKESAVLGASILPDGLSPNFCEDFSGALHFLHAEEIEVGTFIEKLIGNFSLEAGRLFSVVVLNTSTDSGWVFFIAHHAVIDDWSWMALRDRWSSYLSAADQRSDKTLFDRESLVSARLVEERVLEGAYDLDVEAWRTVLNAGKTSSVCYRPTHLERAAFNLGAAPQELAHRLEVSLAAVLLSYVAHGLWRLEPEGATVVDLERNGRRGTRLIDLSDTIGWVAIHHPVDLRHEPLSERSIIALDKALEKIPDEGVSYGALRWGSSSLVSEKIARISVNISQEIGVHALSSSGRAFDSAGAERGRDEILLPYHASVVFRERQHAWALEIAFDPAEFPATNIDSLGRSLETAVPIDIAKARTEHASLAPFSNPIPASAMQRLMLIKSRNNGARCYFPRQLLKITSGRHRNLAEIVVSVLIDYPPFRTRFQLVDGRLMQSSAEPDDFVVYAEPDETAEQWVAGSPAIDVEAILEGARPLTAKIFQVSPSEIYLGLEVHHALFDGHSNSLLLRLIDDAVSLNRPRQQSWPSYIEAKRRFVAAERDFSGSLILPGPDRTLSAVRHWAIASMVIPPELVGVVRRWAARKSLNVRSVFAAVAIVVVHRRMPAFPAFVVQNGRDPLILDDDDVPGMYWYYQPVPTHHSFSVSAKVIHELGLQPISELRSLAVKNWENWLSDEGVSINVQAGGHFARMANIEVTFSEDIFHYKHQLHVFIEKDGSATLTVRTATELVDDDIARSLTAEYCKVLEAEFEKALD